MYAIVPGCNACSHDCIRLDPSAILVFAIQFDHFQYVVTAGIFLSGGGGGQGGGAGADPGFFAGGVNDGRVTLAPTPTGGLGLINMRLRYIASIEYSERFFFIFFFAS